MINKLKEWVSIFPDKIAITYQDQTITYGELFNQISETEKQNPIIFEKNPMQQLICFLRGLYQEVCPILCHPSLEATDIVKNQLQCQSRPEIADFGILTSGTSYHARIIWRTLGSWKDFFEEQARKFKLTADSHLFCLGSLSFSGNLNMALCQLFLCKGCLCFKNQ
ncbi:hypothetical protein HMPREF9318_01363 [Streptococcus urinalis FB127-CNA-2]|uniref:AMP-binding enzyme domain protein n=1 Tax=Streptococcus urinalis 2285-97 TaxID=764291 RepID=G5KD23_9STRE|nr:hypothetical protein [Streptococcus urinalis]EHJ56692.1 hypothetical protein STRUR_0541 [Streptococcus urinalis 2285-97]EKS19287.1 hypothetical protein HMPREF9318_01363 [Streptococcus urinalis FB127-CNA-2]VEF31418.1 long-chain-fatty-acid-CoA ligase [Streptococcus urinalis]